MLQCLNNLRRALTRLIIQNHMLWRLLILQRNHQPNRLFIPGVRRIMALALGIHRKKQPIMPAQDQRLLLRFRGHRDVDHPGQVHDDLGIGCPVQAVFLAWGPRDVGDVRGVCEVHVQGAGFGTIVGGRGGEGGGELPAFEGGGGVVWGVDDGGCGEVLLVFGLGLRGEEGRGEGKEREEGEEAHFVE